MRLYLSGPRLVVIVALASAGLTTGTQQARALQITIPGFQATASDPSAFVVATGGDLAGVVSASPTSPIVLTVSSFTIDIEEQRNAASWSSLSIAAAPIDFGGGRMILSLAREEAYGASLPGVSTVVPAGNGTYRVDPDGEFSAKVQDGAFAGGNALFDTFLGSTMLPFQLRFSWFLDIQDLAQPGALGNLAIAAQFSNSNGSISGTDPVTGDFLRYQLRAAGGFIVNQSFVVVPEPSSAFLTLVGLGWLAVGRHRKA